MSSNQPTLGRISIIFVHVFTRECHSTWYRHFLPHIHSVATVVCKSLKHKSNTFHAVLANFADLYWSNLRKLVSVKRTKTWESHGSKFQNVHHSQEHSHSNDYATAVCPRDCVPDQRQHRRDVQSGAQPRFQSLGSNSLVYGITSLLQKKIRQVYPVWCSRLHNHTLFIKKLCKKSWEVRPNFGEVRTPHPMPPVVAPMRAVFSLYCHFLTFTHRIRFASLLDQVSKPVILVFVWKFTAEFIGAVTFFFFTQNVNEMFFSLVKGTISLASVLCRQIDTVCNIYIVNVSVWFIFTCKVASQKLWRSMDIWKVIVKKWVVPYLFRQDVFKERLVTIFCARKH